MHAWRTHPTMFVHRSPTQSTLCVLAIRVKLHYVTASTWLCLPVTGCDQL